MELHDSLTGAAKAHEALSASRVLLDSVAFVATVGDTQPVIDLIDAVMPQPVIDLIDAVMHS